MKKKALVIGSIAAATVLAGGLALAQSPGHGGFGPGGMQGMHGQKGQGMHGQMGQGMHGQMGPSMHGQMGAGMHGGPSLTQFDPTRIDTLKTELGITPAQELAWTKYATAVKDAATAMKTTHESVDPATVSKLSPADRFAFVSKIREQAQKHFETVKTAANELLTTLDDAQKAKAQETLPGLAFGPGSMRGAGIGGPQHRH
jgi:LTXXQ motif family protein